MKIAFNRLPRRSPWGGGAHFATAYADYLTKLGHKVTYALELDVDWIVMLDPRPEEGGFSAYDIMRFKEKNPHVKVLHRINDTGVTRGGDQLDRLILSSNTIVANKTVFISEWVKQHFLRKGFYAASENYVIVNGCDTQYFYPSQRNSVHSPTKIVTHHWSNNPAKGLDLYSYIDAHAKDLNVEFTYIGRYPSEYKSQNTNIINPLYGHELGDELRKHDVYVTAARNEACGSHHVEGAACGMPVIFHKDGGGVVEMAVRYGIGIDKAEDFKHALSELLSNYSIFSQKVLACDLSATTMCRRYIEIMK